MIENIENMATKKENALKTNSGHTDPSELIWLINSIQIFFYHMANLIQTLLLSACREGQPSPALLSHDKWPCGRDWTISSRVHKLLEMCLTMQTVDNKSPRLAQRMFRTFSVL